MKVQMLWGHLTQLKTTPGGNWVRNTQTCKHLPVWIIHVCLGYLKGKFLFTQHLINHSGAELLAGETVAVHFQ